MPNYIDGINVGGTMYTISQNNVVVDDAPTQNSPNPVSSNGVYAALQGKQNKLTFDNSPQSGSSNPVKSSGIYTALQGKQDTLTIDATPTNGSSNPVSSDGVYDALALKQNKLTFDSAPTQNSSNPVTSGGIYTALQNVSPSITMDDTVTQNSSNPVKSSGIWTAIQNITPSGTVDEYPIIGSGHPIASDAVFASKASLASVVNQNSAVTKLVTGDYFWWKNKLCRAVTDISAGTSFVENTNCVSITSLFNLFDAIQLRTATGKSASFVLQDAFAWYVVVTFVDTPVAYNANAVGVYFVPTSGTDCATIYSGQYGPTVSISRTSNTATLNVNYNTLPSDATINNTQFYVAAINLRRFLMPHGGLPTE